MNFVDLSIQFQAEVSQENPRTGLKDEAGSQSLDLVGAHNELPGVTNSNLAPEAGPNHPHLEQMWVVLYSRPSDIVVGKQAGTVQDGLRKALETIERHVPEEWEKGKKQFRQLAIPDMQADDLEDIGILVGEDYDEKIIQEGCSVRVPIIV